MATLPIHINRMYRRVKNVSRTGASAGMVLRGITRSNHGFRVRILQDQPPGNWGIIAGSFIILDAGQNMHSEALQPLVGQTLDAAGLLQVIRREHPTCVNIVNGRIVAAEARRAAARRQVEAAS